MNERILYYNLDMSKAISSIQLFMKDIDYSYILYEEENKDIGVTFNVSINYKKGITLNAKIENENFSETKELINVKSENTKEMNFEITKDNVLYRFIYIKSDNNLKLATELISFLCENNIFDANVYFDGLCISIRSDNKVKVYSVDPTKIFTGALKASVNMTFEGQLYHAINYNNNKKLLKEFDKIFENNNCYYELYDAWNLKVVYNY